jgi:DNA-binding MarR family transcriptional regulator
LDSTSILINIRKILRSVNLESKRIQKEYGISIPQLLTLNYLSNQPEYKATHKEVSKYLNLNSSTITGIISRLEKKGWIAKLRHTTDKRISYVILTALGQKLLQNTPQLMHEKLAHKFESTSQEHMQELQRAFDLLIDFMGIEDLDASPLLSIDELDSE